MKPGRQIALRRDDIGLNQDQLAERARVSRSSVWKLENNRKVKDDTREAILDALAAEERKRGVTGSVIATSTTEASMKEGADDVSVAVLEDLSVRVANLETLLATGLSELRVIRLELDNRIARRKSG